MTAITATVEGIAASANADAWLVHRGRFLDVTFLLGVGDTSYLVRIHRGRVEAIAKGPFVMPRWTFSLEASEAAWRTFWQPVPPPGCHDLIAMIKTRRPGARGRPAPLLRQSALLQGAAGVASPLRPNRCSGRRAMSANPDFEPAVGRYLRLPIQGKPHRLYVEEAGAGIPLVCLHTAGADSRQYRGLINDAEILSKLPRHRLRHALARQVLAARRLAATPSTSSPRAPTSTPSWRSSTRWSSTSPW